MPSPVEIVDYDPGWAGVFADLGVTLRYAIGDVAVRIDHIGSTAYADEKRRCAVLFRHDRSGYVEAKDSFVWSIIRHADAWAQHAGWAPGPSDA